MHLHKPQNIYLTLLILSPFMDKRSLLRWIGESAKTNIYTSNMIKYTNN